MNNKNNIWLFLVVILTTTLAFRSTYPTSIIPADWPEVVYDFSQNPPDSIGFVLGRKLFYDPNLSRDKTISCASCHLQFTGFTHVDHALSHGIEGKIGTRNSPVLINLIWQSNFHWDGGVNHLDAQAINPITHPAEMDNSLDSVLSYLRNDKRYVELFEQVFEGGEINTKNVMKAFSQFTTQLISSNSKYDQYRMDNSIFNEQEKHGLALFEQHCATCHTAPLFQNNSFRSNGLPMDTTLNDVGRYAITHRPEDSMKFKVPTLRNIQFTGPYMHDGRFKKLSQVIDHYAQIDPNDRYLSNELKRKIVLSDSDKKDLIAFLYTLTDKEFLYNPELSYPRNE